MNREFLYELLGKQRDLGFEEEIQRKARKVCKRICG